MPCWCSSVIGTRFDRELTAERLGVTLVGFLRGDGFNVYARPDRVAVGRA